MTPVTQRWLCKLDTSVPVCMLRVHGLWCTDTHRAWGKLCACMYMCVCIEYTWVWEHT